MVVGSIVVIAAATVAAALKNNLGLGIDPTIETTVDRKKPQKQSAAQKKIDAISEEEFQALFKKYLIEELESPEIQAMIREHVLRDMEKFEQKQAQERQFENSEWRINYREMTEKERDEFWAEKDKLVNFYGERWMKRHHKDGSSFQNCDPSDPTIETTLDELIPGEGKEMVIMTPSGTWKNGIKFHNKKADEILKKREQSKKAI